MNHLHGDGDEHRLGRLMHQLHGVLGPSPEDVVDIEMPRHQLRALFAVSKDGPISVGHLAETTEASLASTSSLADRLVRSGYLQRTVDPADRRRVMLSATPDGLAVVERLESRFHDRFTRLVGAMSPEGRAGLEAGLLEMIRAADELGLRTDPIHPQRHPGARV